MMTLLRGLHSIAAQRGDGLRPELLRMVATSPGWSEVERISNAAVNDDIDGKHERRSSQSAEVVALPPRPHNEPR